ncbi:MAG: filamentous hemagglutinin N-terminal domain-containing protein [Cyanobacteria bacterium J06633_8]
MNERNNCNLSKSFDTLISGFMGAAFTGFLQFSMVSPVIAQITPDNTLGNSPSVVNNQSLNNLLIEGGVKNNSNLFHSFQEFNINQGQQVFFYNPQNINNIITRITGNNPSNINGTLGVNGAANLFLINPKGIIFGAGSSLDINGSFIGSTADSINFSDGNIFSAVEPNNPQLLQINVPLGLQYGKNPASIQLQQAELQVKPGKTLGLIGGNVSLDNTTLRAAGGTVKLGGLLSAGIVNLNPTESLIFPTNVTLGDVSLINESLINVMDEGGGNIFVEARNFSLSDSNLRAGIKRRLGNENAISGDIIINSTENTNILDNSEINNTLEGNSLGNGGQIAIKSNNFFLKDSIVSTDSESSGNGGNLIVEATNKLEIISSPINFTLKRGEGRKGLFARVEAKGTGNGGSITVKAPEISVSGLGGIISK